MTNEMKNNDTKIKKLLKGIKNQLKAAVRTPWFWMLMLFPAALILLAAARNIPGAADLYCNTVYRAISVIWNNISGILPLSVGEILVILVPFAAAAYIIAVVIIIIRAKGKRLKKLFLGIVRPVAAASVLYFLFITNCGINYCCSNVSQQSGLAVREVSAGQLYEVCVYLADQASYYRSRIQPDENEPVRVDISTACYNARDAVNGLHSKYSFVPEGYSVPKSVILSRGMSYLDITGIYFPFTFEANVNTDSRNFTTPFTMCHELAHVRGFMHEADANFIAFLACINSESDEFRYSGFLCGLQYLSGHLSSADTELYSSFFKHLSYGVLCDLKDKSDYWKQFETPVAVTAAKINDSYLKHNFQQEGVKSYGMAADLIIAYYFDEISRQ